MEAVDLTRRYSAALIPVMCSVTRLSQLRLLCHFVKKVIVKHSSLMDSVQNEQTLTAPQSENGQQPQPQPSKAAGRAPGKDQQSPSDSVGGLEKRDRSFSLSGSQYPHGFGSFIQTTEVTPNIFLLVTNGPLPMLHHSLRAAAQLLGSLDHSWGAEHSTGWAWLS